MKSRCYLENNSQIQNKIEFSGGAEKKNFHSHASIRKRHAPAYTHTHGRTHTSMHTVQHSIFPTVVNLVCVNETVTQSNYSQAVQTSPPLYFAPPQLHIPHSLSLCHVFHPTFYTRSYKTLSSCHSTHNILLSTTSTTIHARFSFWLHSNARA